MERKLMFYATSKQLLFESAEEVVYLVEDTISVNCTICKMEIHEYYLIKYMRYKLIVETLIPNKWVVDNLCEFCFHERHI